MMEDETMMLSEFIERTGFEPMADEYAEIEEAYYGFDGDKNAFASTGWRLWASRASARPAPRKSSSFEPRCWTSRKA